MIVNGIIIIFTTLILIALIFDEGDNLKMKTIKLKVNNIIMEFTAIPDKIKKSKGLKPIFMKIKKRL